MNNVKNNTYLPESLKVELYNSQLLYENLELMLNGEKAKEGRIEVSGLTSILPENLTVGYNA